MEPFEPNFEPVFVAGNVREIQVLEELLETEGIDYVIRPGTFTHAITAGGAFYGLVFSVLSGQAAYCRQLFARHDLRKGIIPAEAAEEIER